jgi:hypothetical protein
MPDPVDTAVFFNVGKGLVALIMILVLVWIFRSDLRLSKGASYSEPEERPQDRRSPRASKRTDEGGTHTLASGSQVYIGEPAARPDRLIRDLCTLLEGNPTVRAGYLAQVYVPGSGDVAHLAIGIACDATLQDVLPAAAELVGRSLPSGAPVDFLELDGSAFSSEFVASAQPFYFRS